MVSQWGGVCCRTSAWDGDHWYSPVLTGFTEPWGHSSWKGWLYEHWLSPLCACWRPCSRNRAGVVRPECLVGTQGMWSPHPAHTVDDLAFELEPM